MKKKIGFLLALILLIVGAFGQARLASATGDVGGQVQNDGEITFYEESTVQSTVASSELPSTGGKLPQTGETIRNYSLIGGGILLALLLVILYRRKKDKEKGGAA
ncbi:LPXTG cell wall anchor domain-containing protein [Enterococcus sp. HY326]|uniref:LPXTG cell wall anchor domain-containing protein n=1 Tax=Enterococcus sp. HY326 TaxID=2971265 RepID=UPI002240E2C0|nr:LPXTG cell wall anchor domain-containing protein [Enterococcus sp. HY326]